MTEPSKPVFSFAHLSDPHLSDLQGVRWSQLANKRLLGYLSWRRRRRAEHRGEVLQALGRDLQQTRPQHIAITGDLTHIGLPDEFSQARRWLESLGDPQQVTVVPGNHDAYVRVPWQQGLSRWQPYMEPDSHSPDLVAEGPEQMFPGLRVRGEVAFIGLSTARPSAPLLATGSLGKQQLERLPGLLRECRERGLFRVVLLHHPPVPGMEKWRKRLTDAERLCEVIATCGAELVLHGHSHRAIHSRIEIPGTHVPVFGIPSASAIGHKPGRVAQYYLYNLYRNGDSWKLDIRVRGYYPEKDEFVQERELSLETGLMAT